MKETDFSWKSHLCKQKNQRFFKNEEKHDRIFKIEKKFGDFPKMIARCWKCAKKIENFENFENFFENFVENFENFRRFGIKMYNAVGYIQTDIILSCKKAG